MSNEHGGISSAEALAAAERFGSAVRQAMRSKPRLRACVERWPDCYEGGYNPYCCRFPKSCSCDVYDPERVTSDDLEGAP